MKARVKKTGEIVELADDCYLNDKDYEHSYYADELESVECDYWEKLKHQYAGMAMQAYINNNVYMREIRTMCKTPNEMREMVADLSVLLATALVDKLKSESNEKKE